MGKKLTRLKQYVNDGFFASNPPEAASSSFPSLSVPLCPFGRAQGAFKNHIREAKTKPLCWFLYFVLPRLSAPLPVPVPSRSVPSLSALRQAWRRQQAAHNGVLSRSYRWPPSGFAWKAFNNPPHYHTRRLCFLPTLEMRNEYVPASSLISKSLRPSFPYGGFPLDARRSYTFPLGASVYAGTLSIAGSERKQHRRKI